MGIEPTNAGATIRCVNHFATFAIINNVILFLNKKLRWVHLSQYRRPGSNRHALNGHWILSPARLPIPPRRQVEFISTKAVTGFEPVMKVLQTSALPLGYTAIILLSVYKVNYRTGVAGFEPTHEGVKVPCLTAWLYPNKEGRMMGIEPTNAGATIRCVNHFATFAMAGAAGIEPTLTVLETAVLPLNYAPM